MAAGDVLPAIKNVFAPRLLLAKSRVGGPNLLLQSRVPSSLEVRQTVPSGEERGRRTDLRARTPLGERGAGSLSGAAVAAATAGQGALGGDAAAAGWALSGVHVCGRAMVSVQVILSSV